MRVLSEKTKTGVFLCIFIALEYFSDNLLQPFSPYTIYVLEMLFVTLFTLTVSRQKATNQIPIKKRLIASAIAILFGAFVRIFAKLQNYSIPFDLTSTETIIFLLMVGPVLEELLYRGVLIRSLKAFTHNSWVIALISSFLFSLSHLKAFPSLPDEFKVFIAYQGFYTFFLGVLCSAVYMRAGLKWSILIHFGFNLGFYLF